MNYFIITNNPLIQQKYVNDDLVVVEKYQDVLFSARDYIHQGYQLLSHPQAGSIKPYETPYRSIIMSCEQNVLDFKSLQYIESALERLAVLSSAMGVRQYDERCLKDFQVIDEGLIRSAMMSMNHH